MQCQNGVRIIIIFPFQHLHPSDSNCTLHKANYSMRGTERKCVENFLVRIFFFFLILIIQSKRTDARANVCNFKWIAEDKIFIFKLFGVLICAPSTLDVFVGVSSDFANFEFQFSTP